MQANNQLKLSAGIASILLALVLVTLKLWALSETSALSIAASLADSAMDLMMSLASLAAIAYAMRPADEDHAFGHSSAEDLTALGQSLFIFVSAGVIAWVAVTRLLAGEPTPLEQTGRGILVMLASILLTAALVAWQRFVAKRTGSKVVEADSLHYVGDLMPTIGAIVSLWAAGSFGLFSVDSIVALASALFMVVGAARIFFKAWNALMDAAADPEIIAEIRSLCETWPGVRGCHDLKTRTAGSIIFINIHIELDGDQSLHEAHAIGASLRRAIVEAHPNTDVIIHKDPV